MDGNVWFSVALILIIGGMALCALLITKDQERNIRLREALRRMDNANV